MVGLVDGNNFYASCELVFRPDLIGKPICVLSNNDGCVIARNREAKALGIPMGAPAFKLEKEFAQKGVHVFSANFSLYGDMSKRVMNTLSEYSPELEVYSIDEIFLNFKGFTLFDLVAYGKEMRARVLQDTGIPTSVGIAPTKALAKLANKIAKKYPQLDNVYLMDTEEKRIKALKWLPVGDVWGIGGQYAKSLNAMGLKTAYDFTMLGDETIRKLMGIVGVRLKRDLEGKPTLSLEDIKVKKNIATTRSFDRNYIELRDIEERVTSFAVSCAEKLRAQNSECSSLSVFVLTNRFRQDLPQYDRNINIKLPFATSSSMEIAKYAVFGLRSIFKEGYSYKKAGVILNDFTPRNQKQLTIFEESDNRHVLLMQVVDQMNTSYGQQKIRLASQDRQLWKMKQEKLSPKYTTRLSDIITVKC